jgi:hypothetical protein
MHIIVVGGGTAGPFLQDTRVLSGWSLTVDGWPGGPLTVRQAAQDAAAFPGRCHRRPAPPYCWSAASRTSPFNLNRPPRGRARIRAVGDPPQEGTYSPGELAGLRRS